MVDVTVFSFHPVKTITTENNAVTTIEDYKSKVKPNGITKI